MLNCWNEKRSEIPRSGNSYTKLVRVVEHKVKRQVVCFERYGIEVRLREWPINPVAENELRHMRGATS
ncbi:hypothetical protein FHS27_003179 [Rhodopirellula rubra]|uniref:Uncharacterized protein n=1 Tax=Aporhodopirellula rubra TaxID=980271 RepID=A0A7W5E0D0_9BACT|nr:hypothetical protein [Aporhodopirellula rubra]